MANRARLNERVPIVRRPLMALLLLNVQHVTGWGYYTDTQPVRKLLPEHVLEGSSPESYLLDQLGVMQKKKNPKHVVDLVANSALLTNVLGDDFQWHGSVDVPFSSNIPDQDTFDEGFAEYTPDGGKELTAAIEQFPSDTQAELQYHLGVNWYDPRTWGNKGIFPTVPAP